VREVCKSEGAPILVTAAKEAVSQWEFEPILLNEKPVPFETLITVVFHLGDQSSASPAALTVVGRPDSKEHDAEAQDVTVESVARIGSQAVRAPRFRKQVRPVYPKEAQEQKIEGLVQIRAIVGKDGKITKLRVVKGHPVLAKAATEAISQWEYQPLLLNGEAVEFEDSIDVIFQLSPPKETKQAPKKQRTTSEKPNPRIP